MLRKVRRGKLSVDDAVERLRNLPYEDLGYAKVDHHRSLRQGFPEVVFARGKDPAHVEGIARRMLLNKHNILITRGDAELFERVKNLTKRQHSTDSAVPLRSAASARFAARGKS